MTHAIRETNVALRWLDRFGLTNCGYRPSRCAAVYAIARLIKVARGRKCKCCKAEHEFDNLHSAVNVDAARLIRMSALLREWDGVMVHELDARGMRERVREVLCG